MNTIDDFHASVESISQ